MKDQPSNIRVQKPIWLKRRLPTGTTYGGVSALLKKSHLHTVCQEAKCPNIWECFSRRTATFLIMGPRCTRNCRFCAVEHGPSESPDPEEPMRVAEAVERMRLRYVVVTSVTRDDLPDGGAILFARTIMEIRRKIPRALIEVLIPDLQGDPSALQTVIEAHPDVLNHNLETVPRLYSSIRPEAIYRRSLELLRQAKHFNSTIPTKSGLMLGLGESSGEIADTLNDLRSAGCDILTLGQYLQPTQGHIPVKHFVHPDAFDDWRDTARVMGFSEVASGPFVRSSYHARELYKTFIGGTITTP